MCSAIPSAPVKFVARLRLTLLYSVIFVCVLCLANIGFVQCFSFGFHKVSYTLLLPFSQNFVLRVLPHKHPVCAVLLPSLPSSLLHACVYFALFGNFLLCLFAFPFSSRQVYTLLVFFALFGLLLLRVLCPTISGLCCDFSPAPLEFARFIFCFVLFSFKFCWVLRSFPH